MKLKHTETLKFGDIPDVRLRRCNKRPSRMSTRQFDNLLSVTLQEKELPFGGGLSTKSEAWPSKEPIVHAPRSTQLELTPEPPKPLPFLPEAFQSSFSRTAAGRRRAICALKFDSSAATEDGCSSNELPVSQLPWRSGRRLACPDLEKAQELKQAVPLLPLEPSDILPVVCHRNPSSGRRLAGEHFELFDKLPSERRAYRKKMQEKVNAAMLRLRSQRRLSKASQATSTGSPGSSSAQAWSSSDSDGIFSDEHEENDSEKEDYLDWLEEAIIGPPGEAASPRKTLKPQSTSNGRFRTAALAVMSRTSLGLR